ncbi:MAG TPA: tripartite tricarboxylate transporter TctB family protein [Stellaceae bacterium]|nr:tripartite tricarboxylate transporter TctB family protein [Stellaceae bacterium]
MSVATRRGEVRKIASGSIFLAFGVAGIVMALGYNLGTPTHVGPGGFPLILSIILAGLGLASLVQGWLAPYAGGLGSWRARAIYLIPLSVVFFGVTVERFGLIPAIVGTTIIAGLANPTIRLIEIAIMCVALAAFGAGVFVYGLDLPFSLWPD